MLLLKRLNGVVSDQTNAELMADLLINIDSVKEKAPRREPWGFLRQYATSQHMALIGSLH